MAEIQTTAADAFSIVIVGAMNPRIHHPQWYRTIGAIDEAELQSTLSGASVLITAMVSQFQFPAAEAAIAINCIPDRWTIQTNTDSTWERIANVAARVFEKLSETPCTIYGFNTQKHVKTEAPNVKDTMATAIAEMQLGFPIGRSLASAVQLQSTEDDHKITVSLQPSLAGESSIFVAYNTEYQAPTAAAGGYFDIGKLIVSKLPEHRERAGAVIQAVVTAINNRLLKQR